MGEVLNGNQGSTEESARLKEVHPGHSDPLQGTIQDHEQDSGGRKLLESEPVTPFVDSIWRWEDGRQVHKSVVPGQVLAPLWQVTPAAASAANVNLLSD
mgnify:CR=1 FL=1|jgi:hypothetical protein